MADEQKGKSNPEQTAEETRQTRQASSQNASTAPGSSNGSPASGSGSTDKQPVPPVLEGSGGSGGSGSGTLSVGSSSGDNKEPPHESEGRAEGHEDHDRHCKEHYHHLEEALESVYTQLREVRKIADSLLKQAIDEKIQKRYELVPVRSSDLMCGFQAAIARANRSTRSNDMSTENIERLSVKDLEISISAPLIESGHAQDPVLMLPNIKSVDGNSANISLKFSIVSVPVKQ